MAAGKGRYDLIPRKAKKAVALVYEAGARKYSDNNWRRGIPFSSLLDSAQRHIDQWAEGERDEIHLAHAIFNLMCLLEFEAEGRTELDDVHYPPELYPGGPPSTSTYKQPELPSFSIADEDLVKMLWAESRIRDHLGLDKADWEVQAREQIPDFDAKWQHYQKMQEESSWEHTASQGPADRSQPRSRNVQQLDMLLSARQDLTESRDATGETVQAGPSNPSGGSSFTKHKENYLGFKKDC